MLVENKTVLITGANGGLGTALVQEFLKQNVKKIYCTARDESKLENLKKLSDKIETLSLDITNKEQIMQLASKIENLDILVNNAGVNSAKQILDDNKFDFDVNTFATLDLTQALYNKINKGGAIVNVTSVLALINLPVMALYCASKSALHSITQALRAEGKKDEISVFEVLPGPIDTNMTKDTDMPKTSPSEVAKSVLDSMAKDEYEIFPDEFAVMIKNRLKDDKEALEKEFAMSVQG